MTMRWFFVAANVAAVVNIVFALVTLRKIALALKRRGVLGLLRSSYKEILEYETMERLKAGVIAKGMGDDYEKELISRFGYTPQEARARRLKVDGSCSLLKGTIGSIGKVGS